jgi:hypothetical protein
MAQVGPRRTAYFDARDSFCSAVERFDESFDCNLLNWKLREDVVMRFVES